MANVYNSAPIRLDSTMASGWRASQTLNTGSVPGYAFTRQPGIRITKLVWTQIAAQGHQISFKDPIDNTILFQAQAGTTLEDIVRDWTKRDGEWRDFQLTRIDSGIVFIWYR